MVLLCHKLHAKSPDKYQNYSLILSIDDCSSLWYKSFALQTVFKQVESSLLSGLIFHGFVQVPCIYCEILFIRGDPIFVVFVDGFAHEFKIPRIMNTISNIIVTIIFELLPILGCTSTVSQEPQCARFGRVFTCSPIV